MKAVMSHSSRHKYCRFLVYLYQTAIQQPPVSTVRYCNET